MNKIVRLFVLTLIAILISSSLIAGGGHKYIAPPVIFVHGFNATMASWNTTKNNLDILYNGKYGYTDKLQYFPLMNYGAIEKGQAFSQNGDCRVIANYYKYVNGPDDLKGLAQVVYSAIGNAFYKSGHAHDSNFALVPEEEQKIILVCHSFGGLVTRSLLKQNENALNFKDATGNQQTVPPNYFKSHIARVIFLDTPHAGSPLASALCMLRESKKETNQLFELYYTHSIDIGYCPANLKEKHYNNIIYYLNSFIYSRNFILSLAELAGVDTSDDQTGYDPAVKQLKLNENVTLKLFISDPFGVHRTLYEYTTPGNSTFLGNANSNLGIPDKRCVIYSSLHEDWVSFDFHNKDAFCRLGSHIYNSMLKDYFIFPPKESLEDLVKNGDSIVTDNSAVAIGGDLHPIDGYSHVQETSQWNEIKKVLCEEAPSIVVDKPDTNVVYTTKTFVQGRIRDYLPLDSSVDVESSNPNQNISGLVRTIWNKNNPNKIILNPEYEEITTNNYQGIFRDYVNLQPYGTPKYDDNITLKMTPSNAGNIKGAEQGINLTYACFVDTTTYPKDGAMEVDPNISSIEINLKENARSESVTTNTVILSGGVPYRVTASASSITIWPQQPLQPDTWYTVTIKGDNPNTGDDLSTPFKIENLEGVQWYEKYADPQLESNLDRQGFELWGLPSVNLRNSQLVRIDDKTG